MAGGDSNSQSGFGPGLRNAVRFGWKDKEKEICSRDFFIRKVVLQALGMDPGRIFCLQANRLENSFDIFFNQRADFCKCLETCKAEAGAAPFSFFNVQSLSRCDFKIVTVTMYNPYVGCDTVAMFLGRFGRVEPGVKLLRDGYGFWGGKRQYRVWLGKDERAADGLLHPPAYFSIGAERGFLFYSGQPSFCRKCRGFGHMAAECVQTEPRCRNCGGLGHMAGGCRTPRTCDGCGKEGHLFRDCPARRRSYADAAAGGTTADHPATAPEDMQEGILVAEEEEARATMAGDQAAAAGGGLAGAADQEAAVEDAMVVEGLAARSGMEVAPGVGAVSGLGAGGVDGDMEDAASPLLGSRRPRSSSEGEDMDLPSLPWSEQKGRKGRKRRNKGEGSGARGGGCPTVPGVDTGPASQGVGALDVPAPEGEGGGGRAVVGAEAPLSLGEPLILPGGVVYVGPSTPNPLPFSWVDEMDFAVGEGALG